MLFVVILCVGNVLSEAHSVPLYLGDALGAVALSFDLIDANNDGSLTLEELRNNMQYKYASPNLAYPPNTFQITFSRRVFEYVFTKRAAYKMSKVCVFEFFKL